MPASAPTNIMLVCGVDDGQCRCLRKARGERRRVLVILGQPLDVMRDGVAPGRRENARLPHAAAQHLAPAVGALM